MDYLEAIKNDLFLKQLSDQKKAISYLNRRFNLNLFAPGSKITILQPELLEKYYREGYFIFTNEQGQESIVISNIEFLEQKEVRGFAKEQINLIEREAFNAVLMSQTADYNLVKASELLVNSKEFHSAKNIDYEKMVAGFFLIFLFLMKWSINLFSIINGILYLVQNLFKSLLFTRSVTENLSLLDHDDYLLLQENDLPVYSILVPLYKEEFKLQAIINAISKLNYPKDKLDVKLVLEKDDVITNQTLLTTNIPHYIEIIKVPYSLPRTKPKALNYAMSFVRGEYITIYDAEDEPDQNQLYKAVAALKKLPDNYACVQAKLNFYNSNKNLLTKLFSIEYKIWFNYLLKGLSILNFPVTLGGTSNHFKTKILREIGMWDAYNVTEDADLGIRLYLKGYKIYMIDSVTLEEAPSDVSDWIAQRARWIKGFIQTLGVFIKTQKDFQKFGLANTAVVYIFVGIASYNFIFFPWLAVLLFSKIHWSVYYFWFINSICALTYMYITAYIAISDNVFQPRTWTDKYLTFFMWPLYFLLHSIASYRALWELVKAPFKWNKTPHGSYEEMSDREQI